MNTMGIYSQCCMGNFSQCYEYTHAIQRDHTPTKSSIQKLCAEKMIIYRHLCLQNVVLHTLAADVVYFLLVKGINTMKGQSQVYV